MVPEISGSQEEAAAILSAWSGDPSLSRMIRYVFQNTGIERRHSVLPDFIDEDRARIFRRDESGVFREPSTQERNRIFIEHAGPMAVELAGRLLTGESGFRKEEVTHVITVSCTGFVNPGPDYRIVTDLGLSPTVERYNLGFMGCYASLPALRLARQICQARRDAVVLVVSIELCTLHLQMRADRDTILANALFSDGAGAALVSARPPRADRATLVLDHFLSALVPEGQGDMAWEIGDRGFNLVLSSYVPDVIATNVNQIVADLLAQGNQGIDDIDLWAVHPGGRAILDKVERSLRLQPEQLQAARETLRDFGNMSSATILFVLQKILAGAETPQRVAAMAFGPGLTIESALMRVVPAAVPAPRAAESVKGQAAILSAVAR
jgi:predicted naringenin-chalcone synthase